MQPSPLVGLFISISQCIQVSNATEKAQEQTAQQQIHQTLIPNDMDI
jgi:hypothetical protein